MASIPGLLFIGNDSIIEVKGLKDELTDAFVNDAVVIATLRDCLTDAEVSGQSWPTTLNYVAGSDGDYRAVLQDTLVLTEGTIYNAEIEAAGVSQAAWTIQVKAVLRN